MRLNKKIFQVVLRQTLITVAHLLKVFQAFLNFYLNRLRNLTTIILLQCSATCGAGWQYRVVSCLAHDGKPGYGCDESRKPTVRQTCLTRRRCFTQSTVFIN